MKVETLSGINEKLRSEARSLWQKGDGSLEDAIATLLTDGLTEGKLRVRTGAADSIRRIDKETAITIAHRYGSAGWRAATMGVDLDLMDAIHD
jgi:hypothetical protein